jgi:hypothetical protein
MSQRWPRSFTPVNEQFQNEHNPANGHEEQPLIEAGSQAWLEHHVRLQGLRS